MAPGNGLIKTGASETLPGPEHYANLAVLWATVSNSTVDLRHHGNAL